MADMLIYAWKPRPRRSRLLAAALSCLAVLPAGAAQAQDWVWGNREMAKTAAMHDIALIQASLGDFQGQADRLANQRGGRKDPCRGDRGVVLQRSTHLPLPVGRLRLPAADGSRDCCRPLPAGVDAIHTEPNTSSLSIGRRSCAVQAAADPPPGTWIPILVTVPWSTSPMSGTPMARA